MVPNATVPMFFLTVLPSLPLPDNAPPPVVAPSLLLAVDPAPFRSTPTPTRWSLPAVPTLNVSRKLMADSSEVHPSPPTT